MEYEMENAWGLLKKSLSISQYVAESFGLSMAFYNVACVRSLSFFGLRLQNLAMAACGRVPSWTCHVVHHHMCNYSTKAFE